MPLILVALLAGGLITYLWIDRRRDQRPELPPGGEPYHAPVQLPGSAQQPILRPDEISTLVQQGQSSTDPRVPLMLAEALKIAGLSAPAAALRMRTLELLGFPGSTPGIQPAAQELGNVPLDLAYSILAGLGANTPASLNRAAWIARTQNQIGLASFVQARNPSPNNAQNFDFTPQDLLALVTAATASSDPQLKLAVAELVERYPIPILGNYAGPALAASLRSEVLTAIPKTTPVAGESSWLTMLSVLPLSYQTLVLTGLGVGTPESITRAADLASYFGPYRELVLSRI